MAIKFLFISALLIWHSAGATFRTVTNYKVTIPADLQEKVKDDSPIVNSRLTAYMEVYTSKSDADLRKNFYCEPMMDLAGYKEFTKNFSNLKFDFDAETSDYFRLPEGPIVAHLKGEQLFAFVDVISGDPVRLKMTYHYYFIKTLEGYKVLGLKGKKPMTPEELSANYKKCLAPGQAPTGTGQAYKE